MKSRIIEEDKNHSFSINQSIHANNRVNDSMEGNGAVKEIIAFDPEGERKL